MSHKSYRSSADIGKFKIPRKTGPSEERHSSRGTSDWQPPAFMKNVLNEISYENNWLNERYGKRGKFQPKTNYKKANSLPQSHFKSRTHFQKCESKDVNLHSILRDLTDETATIEETLTDWKQWKKNYDRNSYGRNCNNNMINNFNKINTIKHKHSDTFIELKQELEYETELQRHQMYKADLKHKQLQNKKEKSLFPLLAINDKNMYKNKSKSKSKKKKRKKSKQMKRNKKKAAKLKREQLKKKHELERIKNMELIAKKNTFKLLDSYRKQEYLNNEQELLFNQINIGKLENDRLKLEKLNANIKSQSKWNGYYSNADPTIFSPRSNRKRKQPKARKRYYRIFYNCNIQTYEKNKYICNDMSHLKYLLYQLFDLENEKNVFDIKTRIKNNGFKIDFGIIVATSMHPSDYIDTFDGLLKDELFQDVIMDSFELDECPVVKVWEARYQKFVVKKERKPRSFF